MEGYSKESNCLYHKCENDMADADVQELMEQELSAYFSSLQTEQPGRFSAMLGLRFHSCNYEKRTLKVCFSPQNWMMNSHGSIHGGVIASAMDVAMGALCRFYSDSGNCPTTELTVRYILPVPVKWELGIRVRILPEDIPGSVHGAIFVNGKEHRALATAQGRFWTMA